MAASGRGFITLLFICGLLHSASATTYNVGGDAGWIKQSKNSTFYDDQFKDITLYVGDSLYFTVGPDLNAVEIPEANLATCNNATVIFRSPTYVGTNGSVTILLNNPGTFGFICDIADDCSQFGMHLKATVTSPPSPTPSPESRAPSDEARAPSKASLLQSGSAMLMLAVLGGSAVLLL